jgi:hypothetical protein
MEVYIPRPVVTDSVLSGVSPSEPVTNGDSPAISVLTASVKKSDLTHLTRDELGLFVTAMIVLNEVNTLMGCVLVTNPQVAEPRHVLNRARTSQMIFFMQVLAGKLSEAWLVLKADTALRQRRNALNDKARLAYDKLAAYYDSNGQAIPIMRNKLAFHYDSERIATLAASLERDETFELWAPTSHTTDARCNAGAVLAASAMNLMLHGTASVPGFERFIEDLSQVRMWTCDLLTSVLELMLHRPLLQTMRNEPLPDAEPVLMPVLADVSRYWPRESR